MKEDCAHAENLKSDQKLKAGWKGKRLGEVGTYEKQALVIVNHGKATGAEARSFAEKVQAVVYDKFGVRLGSSWGQAGGNGGHLEFRLASTWGPFSGRVGANLAAESWASWGQSDK